MGIRLRQLAFSLPLGDEDPRVERPGPGQPPTAFRIWGYGGNPCDGDVVVFNEAAAEKLLAEQGDRNRTYSFDFDHLSLERNRPADAGRAAGYHRLEVRKDSAGKPELWAVEIEWCQDVAAGLSEDPPRWRYYSPAFYTDEAGVITSYVNCAICINPRTHDLPALAAVTPRLRLKKNAEGVSYDSVIQAVNRALSDRYPPTDDGMYRVFVVELFEATVVFELDGGLFELSYAANGEDVTLGNDPVEVERKYVAKAAATKFQVKKTAIKRMNMDKKALLAALATICSSEASDEDKKTAQELLASSLAEMGDDPPAGDKDKPEESSEDGEGGEDEDKDPSKQAISRLTKENMAQRIRLDAIEAKELVAARPDLPEGTVKWLLTQPLATVKSFVKDTPKQVERRKSVTQDVVDDDGTEPEFDKMDRAFGLKKASAHTGLGKPQLGIRTLSYNSQPKKGA